MELLPASVIKYSCVGKELLEGGGEGEEKLDLVWEWKLNAFIDVAFSRR